MNKGARMKQLFPSILAIAIGLTFAGPVSANPCAITSVERADGFKTWSPNGRRFILNKKDKKGVYQFYVGRKGERRARCITCRARPNAPPVNRHKLQPRWHPSGKWIVLAGERRKYNTPLFATKKVIEGLINSGLWVNIYMTRPDGSKWYRMSDFANNQADGFTGVAFSPDGKQAVWAEIIDGNVFQNTFGIWRLKMANFYINRAGQPRFIKERDITPRGAKWVEVGNFSPDGKSLMISSDIGMRNAQGMDQFVLNTRNGRFRNLTNSRKLWDEHGLFSPDGQKVIYMSSYPFRDDRFWHNPIFLKTELMMIDKNGRNLTQLTHFNTPGYPESNRPSNPRSVAANGSWHPDGRSITALNLFFPDYEAWTINFAGRCGNQRP